MVSVDKAVIARYKHADHSFEMLVDPDLALALRQGKQVSFNDLLASEEVFKDARKGEAASESLVKKVFGTNEVSEIAKRIITRGEVHLTTEQKRKVAEEIRKKVISLIASKAVDPKTKAPHPPQRIELAMEQAKVHLDPVKPAEEQVAGVIEALRPIIPISIENVKIEVRIPAEYAGRAFGVIKHYKALREEWQSDGSLLAVVELPAGTRDKFISEVNGVTHGNSASRLV